MKKIRCALALGSNNTLEDVAFSDALKYRIIEFDTLTNKATTVAEAANPSLHLHDMDKKSSALFAFLKEHDVKFLAARRFGLLVKLENKKYVPVIVESEWPEEVIPLLMKHLDWLRDELRSTKNEFMVFKIGDGILKYRIS
ncbi:MAG: hypothetical protein U5K79_19400 [Cyclobacteriaceae bacterium]|nr:hypothetical protein [Cyclobacteriaceae bacterium]